MEPRGATARYDAATDHYTLRSCSQGAYPQREQLIAVMGLPREKVRIITEDVGGAFGLKTPVYPEYPALLVAAKLTGRPVAWMATRSESFLSDQHARDTVTQAELAIDPKGKFLALRVKHIGRDRPLHRHPGREHATMNFSRCFPGVSVMPGGGFGMQMTLPRRRHAGAAIAARGSSEADSSLKRLVDEAAHVTGIDPVRLRRRNLIPPKAFPSTRGRHDLLIPATSRRSSTRRWRSPATRNSRSAAATTYGARSCAASASRAFSSMRARCRPRAPRRYCRRRQAGARHRRAEHRTRPRHGLSASGRREARHPAHAVVEPAWRRRPGTWKGNASSASCTMTVGGARWGWSTWGGKGRATT